MSGNEDELKHLKSEVLLLERKIQQELQTRIENVKNQEPTELKNEVSHAVYTENIGREL